MLDVKKAHDITYVLLIVILLFIIGDFASTFLYLGMAKSEYDHNKRYLLYKQNELKEKQEARDAYIKSLANAPAPSPTPNPTPSPSPTPNPTPSTTP